nr:MAG TPA: hypothetical protein [Caudoviricetes sp.]
MRLSAPPIQRIQKSFRSGSALRGQIDTIPEPSFS